MVANLVCCGQLQPRSVATRHRWQNSPWIEQLSQDAQVGSFAALGGVFLFFILQGIEGYLYSRLTM
jgi:hypothetical protein